MVGVWVGLGKLWSEAKNKGLTGKIRKIVYQNVKPQLKQKTRYKFKTLHETALFEPIMRKHAFCICKNKGEDQLCDDRAVISAFVLLYR